MYDDEIFYSVVRQDCAMEFIFIYPSHCILCMNRLLYVIRFGGSYIPATILILIGDDSEVHQE